MMPDLNIELYWSFRSPYSYLVLPRVLALIAHYEVSVDIRFVHPNALRTPNYFQRMDPLARPYFFHDSVRAAQFHGLPFARPVPDPIVQDPLTLALAAEQPLARRLGRLGVAAHGRKKGLPFAKEVSELLWSGAVKGWDEGSHLADAAHRAGLDLDELDAAIAADPEGHEAQLAANDAALHEAGHWGVPTMVFRGEPFFGQDRFDMLVWRLRQHGLKERVSAR
jgi:2-hydroxychromene-2-carboxylate isomerase